MRVRHESTRRELMDSTSLCAITLQYASRMALAASNGLPVFFSHYGQMYWGMEMNKNGAPHMLVGVGTISMPPLVTFISLGNRKDIPLMGVCKEDIYIPLS